MVKIGDVEHLTPEELVERWSGRITEGTLANWRSQNKGPKYVFLGGVLYPIKEIEKYESQNLTVSD